MYIINIIIIITITVIIMVERLAFTLHQFGAICRRIICVEWSKYYKYIPM